MARQLPMPRIASRVRGRPVAAYRSVRGAALATQRLAAAGHDPSDVTIRPVLLDAERSACRRLPDEEVQRRRSALLAAGASFAGAIVVMGVRPLSLFIAAALASLASLAAVGVVALWRWWTARRIDHAGRLVRARAFEVMVAADADEAEHELATWWDPAAPPAPTRR